LANQPALLLADEPTGALDSQTGQEVLALFRDLHAQGNTVLLVTHDPSIAALAERRVEIRDGLIHGGEGRSGGPRETAAAAETLETAENIENAEAGARNRRGGGREGRAEEAA
jgi:putative ABC transport system ATP-binding protein